MTRLYRHPLSGHCHRAELFLSLIGREAELVDVDLLAGAQQEADFLKLNPLGQVPVLEDEGAVIADSNAILVYLAERYADPSWYPAGALPRTEIQRWLSVAAGEIAHGPAAARLAVLFGMPLDLEQAKATAAKLFAMMESHLAGRAFLVGETPTIADLAGYSYIARAPEGGIALEPYPAIRAWLARIEDLPGFVPMPITKAA